MAEGVAEAEAELSRQEGAEEGAGPLPMPAGGWPGAPDDDAEVDAAAPAEAAAPTDGGDDAEVAPTPASGLRLVVEATGDSDERDAGPVSGWGGAHLADWGMIGHALLILTMALFTAIGPQAGTPRRS